MRATASSRLIRSAVIRTSDRRSTGTSSGLSTTEGPVSSPVSSASVSGPGRGDAARSRSASSTTRR